MPKSILVYGDKPGFFNTEYRVIYTCILLAISSCTYNQKNTLAEDSNNLSGSNESTHSMWNIDINNDIPWVIEWIDELRKGDILVKPNINLLPGTAFIENGWGYGHAAIVTQGAQHQHRDSILANSWIFESHAQSVPKNDQLREIRGFVVSNNRAFHNEGFGPKYNGNRYQLRLNISESQIDSIIAFMRSQKGSYSSWNSMKRFPGITRIDQVVNKDIRENWADNTHWYCSLLIWQAVLYVTGIDLDPNGGYFVYPNDLIASPYFDNTTEFQGRARF
ncbi:MAG: hypothetical protein U1C46_05400 [Bacteroidales bacterium]|nr:hypothetical protein [Bacteroidales bacterium]MDZ4204236.1 hypothetical protein [Bacteroidales bacterium]